MPVAPWAAGSAWSPLAAGRGGTRSPGASPSPWWPSSRRTLAGVARLSSGFAGVARLSSGFAGVGRLSSDCRAGAGATAGRSVRAAGGAGAAVACPAGWPLPLGACSPFVPRPSRRAAPLRADRCPDPAGTCRTSRRQADRWGRSQRVSRFSGTRTRSEFRLFLLRRCGGGQPQRLTLPRGRLWQATRAQSRVRALIRQGEGMPAWSGRAYCGGLACPWPGTPADGPVVGRTS